MPTSKHNVAALASLVLLTACATHQAAVRPTASPTPDVVESPSPEPSVAPSPAPTATRPKDPPLPPPTAGPLPGQSLPLSGPLSYPLLIQIEDTFPSRPTAGLGAASVIFEYITEGGVLRFSALFHRVPGVVGPVRSARFVSVYLYQRFGALMMASGGSHWTYQRITATNQFEIINDFNHGYFFRWDGRTIPHNLYTSQADMLHAASIGALPPRPDDFLRSTTWSGSTPATQVSVAGLRSTFTWDGHGYAVASDGAPQSDVISGVIHAQGVAVLHVPQWITNLQEDSTGGLARDFDLTTGGAAELYANGTVIHGHWATTGASGAISLTDGAGNPVGMPPGLLWTALAA